MKLSFKTLQQKSFSVEIPTDKLVKDLKQDLSTRPELACDSDQMKLIFKGKILDDSLVVIDIGAGEKDFIVVMVTKKKVQTASPVPATPTPTSTAKVNSPAVPAQTPATATSNPTPVPQQVPTSTDENTLATGSTLQVAIANLVDMGFPRDQVMLAMRAAYNNPDRAAEYLMTVSIGNQGIPSNLQQEVQPATTQTTQPAQNPTTTTGAAAPQSGYVNLFNQGAQQAQATPAAGISSGNLDFLRQSPQFIQLRQMVQQRPELLQPLLAEIAQSNPGLIEVFSFNDR